MQILMRVHLAHLNLARKNYEIDINTNLTHNSWQDEARLNISGMLSCEPGRAMWKIFSPQLPNGFQKLGQEILEGTQGNRGIADLVEEVMANDA